MSAAAERAALARIGAQLVALAGERGERRARALVDRTSAPAATSFADLAAAPAWLQRPRPALLHLATAVALVAMAPAVAASIDGAWLRDLAARAGDEALDRAIAIARQVPGGGVPAVAVDGIEALGFDLLRVALPTPLHRYLLWAPSGGGAYPPALASFALAAADATSEGAA